MSPLQSKHIMIKCRWSSPRMSTGQLQSLTTITMLVGAHGHRRLTGPTVSWFHPESCTRICLQAGAALQAKLRCFQSKAPPPVVGSVFCLSGWTTLLHRCMRKYAAAASLFDLAPILRTSACISCLSTCVGIRGLSRERLLTNGPRSISCKLCI